MYKIAHKWFHRTPLSLLLVIIISFTLYFPSLDYFFFQDDWFVLNWVRFYDSSSFFQPRQDIIYYRPLSMPLYFFTLEKVFGLNHFSFHVTSFALFAVLVVSIYKFFLLITQSKKLGLIAAFLYGTWSIHFISLSWISTTSYILVTLFLIWSFIFFIKFTKDSHWRTFGISFSFFLFAILSHEFAIVFPALLLSWGLIFKKRNYFRNLIPFIVVVAFYLSVRLLIYPPYKDSSYDLTINHLTINNFLWYVLWSFNIPESFKDLINQKFAEESLKRLIAFWQISLPVLAIIILTAKLAVSRLSQKKVWYQFAIVWFVLGLLPIVGFVSHSYPVYLSFAGLGLILLLVICLESASKQITAIFLIVWLISSAANLQFTRATHWINNEQKISKAYYGFIKKKNLVPPSGSAIVFKKPDLSFSEKYKFLILESKATLKQTLNADAFAQVIWNDASLRSYFPEEETIQIPPKTLIFEVNPRAQDDY